MQALQAAVVLEPFHAGAASDGHHSQVTALRGHTVWVSSRNNSGWIFVSSQGREGWIPTESLLGNATVVSIAAKVHTGILVVSIVGVMLAACSIVAAFARDFSLPQSVMATVTSDNLHCEVPLVCADSNITYDETQDRLLAQVGTT